MSKFTLNTITLQNVVTKAIKAAGFNKLLPITGMIGLRNELGKLCLTTSDGTNYLYVYTDIDTDEDFSVVVNAEMFAKLVAKLTSENVTLTITNEALVVTCNGEYKLALQLNDTGDALAFMDVETYEQIEIPYALVEDEKKFIRENSVVEISKYGDEIIGVILPDKVTLTIVECEPAVKGDTKTNATKDAKLETGYLVKVPMFIENGEEIVISTIDGKYSGRA